MDYCLIPEWKHGDWESVLLLSVVCCQALCDLQVEEGLQHEWGKWKYNFAQWKKGRNEEWNLNIDYSIVENDSLEMSSSNLSTYLLFQWYGESLKA